MRNIRDSVTPEDISPLTGLEISLYSNFRIYEEDVTMKDFIRVMKALSDPNRVKLLKILQHKAMCVCEIQVALRIAQPTVSKHLKILEHAGLVGHTKKGLWVNYYLTNGSNSPYAASLLGNLNHWLSDDPDIRNVVGNIPTIRREDICKRP
jgi:ArsR family transcriptional regulator